MKEVEQVLETGTGVSLLTPKETGAELLTPKRTGVELLVPCRDYLRFALDSLSLEEITEEDLLRLAEE